MEGKLKSAGWFSIAVAVIFIALGITMITHPEVTLEVVSVTSGIIFLAVGIVKVINYFVQKGNYDFYNYELIHGLVAFAVGTIILAYTSQVSALFVALIGIWITYSGLMSLTLSMKLQATKIGSWLIIFIMSLIMMIGGLYIVAYPTTVIVFVGIIMIIYALMELIQNIVFIKNIDEIYKDK